MWPHSGVDLGPIKMANIPDDGVVSKIVDCCQIDDVKQSCEYWIIYLSFFLKRCLIIESILILSRIQQLIINYLIIYVVSIHVNFTLCNFFVHNLR